MDAAQGFAAQGAGAVVILLSSHFGYPLSSTHVISGGVMGAGAAKRLSAVRWGVAGNIAAAWVVTLPVAGLFGAGAYALAIGFGHGALGPAADRRVVALAGRSSTTLATRRRRLTRGRERLSARPPEPSAAGPGAGDSAAGRRLGRAGCPSLTLICSGLAAALDGHGHRLARARSCRPWR